ncbi:RcpC/CpaB family pilus assembly protein [Streptomyces sp. WG-D5]
MSASVPYQLSIPPTTEVPPFAPVRVRGARWRPGRAGRRRRGPVVAVGLALTAAALAAAVPSSGAGQEAGPARGRAAPAERAAPAAVTVSAPVRIADAGAVRLLRPGDRVDVVAARADGRAGVRVLASGARVASVPKPGPTLGQGAQIGETSAEGGALVVLTVARATATRLAGAGAASRLAVTVW